MKKVVTFGEIMMRLKTPEFLRFEQATSFDVSYGGAESNVAISLAKFGLKTEFITRMPQNDIANAAMQTLRKYDVTIQNIIFGGDRLGTYYFEAGAVNRSGKVIYDRMYSSMSEIKPEMIDWDSIFEDTNWFHWSGITAAISQDAADTLKKGIEVAKNKNITISCDINYRDSLWNYGKKAHEIMPALISDCDVLLIDEVAARLALGFETKHDNEAKKSSYAFFADQLLMEYPNLKVLTTSCRDSISASHHILSGKLYTINQMYTSPSYEIVPIVDRVGGGDAFMAGIIYGLLLSDNEFEKTLNFAVAASSLKHTIQGDYNLVSVEEVENLMAGNTSGRISR
jgi:2-dehydro-3-deoxygluconokinase